MITFLKNVILRVLFQGFFKKKLLRYIRRNRFYYPEISTDFTFITQIHSVTPPSTRLARLLHNIVEHINTVLVPRYQKEFESTSARHIFDFNNHYMFLLAFANVTRARRIIEIGTASGSSLWSWLSAEYTQTVYTWDIVPLAQSKHWFTSSSHEDLVRQILNDQRFTQFIEDLSEESTFKMRLPLIQGADIIFIDGPHCGFFEERLFRLITDVSFTNDLFVIFDDIHVSSMKDFWHSIKNEKIDATAFAHCTGTGIVFIQGTLGGSVLT
jgi:hypothetical protein